MSISWRASAAAPAAAPGIDARPRRRRRPLEGVRERGRRLVLPELWALLAASAVLDLWDLSRNHWANVYYSAAVRSMSTSWHDFLFASLDRGGVMTVDKPPLALWIQALSVRVFGYHPLSILVPQALIGIATVGLVYDLVRRRFGRLGGFIAGLALALTPMTVAISRHNNPDALLVLCSAAALWCAVRGLERGRTRWLVAAGVCVGLGFETKMGVALVVVPGIAAAWLWIAPAARGRLHALRQLLLGGAAMVLIGGAWPALVELTPAADRPWVSGTSDNSILSLIFEYNGLGRVSGQAGGPAGAAGGGANFGGAAGPLRLIGEALGGQVSWLLGFALVSGIALVMLTRLRRDDARTGWLVALGGAFLTCALLFSFASGIFHPYYVSLLAPFLAAFVGAGAASLVSGAVAGRVFGPLAVIAAVLVELIVRGDYPGQLRWLAPVLIIVGVAAAVVLAAFPARRVRLVALGAALAALLLAPAAWSLDTLGYATSSTFPAGGPQGVASGGPGGFGGPGGGLRPGGRARALRLFGGGEGGAPAGGGAGVSGAGIPGIPGAAQGAGLPGAAGAGVQGPGGAGIPGAGIPGAGIPGLGTSGAGGHSGAVAGGGAFGASAASLKGVLSYIDSHGGGTLAVSSQSTAAAAIIEDDAQVAGIGGFSGRESEVNARWLAQEVRQGKIRWVLSEEGTGATSAFGSGGLAGAGSFAPPGALFGGTGASSSAAAAGPRPGGLPGDTRAGSRPAMEAVAKACVRVDSGSSSVGQLYDCRGRAAELAAS